MSSILYQPSESKISQTRLTQFCQHVQSHFGHSFAGDYRNLHTWSIANREAFWQAVWDFTNVIGEPGTQVLHSAQHLTDDRWFPDAKLNFAENLMRPELLKQSATAEQAMLVAVSEAGDARTWTRQDVFEAAASLAAHFTSIGIQPGDRVAAVLPNCAEAVIAMLATSVLGAIWSSCSPDFGDDAICDRFSQIDPRLLITTAGCQYNGKRLSPIERVTTLLPRLPSIQQIVLAGNAEPFEQVSRAAPIPIVAFDNILLEKAAKLEFPRFAFNHPAFVLYSSGTTGKPKCIVHGAGGTLLQHLKEHQLHSDLRPNDVMMYYTTTGWMMWNWLVSGLASAATIVLYDGNPLYPNDNVLFEIADRYSVTHFGTSAKYLSAIEKRGCKPILHQQGGAMRVLLSTGSPLMPESFEYVYRNIKTDVHLASISGGTDIVSCFLMGNPNGAVHRGEMQCSGLGMDVQVFDDAGKRIFNQSGELVCKQSFPSMPIGFWKDENKQRYRESYFDRFDNVWCHGDWAQEQADTGGWIIHGRSDATLNPGGVRIGTAEIYQQVEAFPEIAEALATAIRRDGDEDIVLFLRMQPGMELDDALTERIRMQLRTRLSPRHVPRWLVSVPDFPRTISGKLSEIAVRRCIHGQAIQNASALANAESLEFFRQWIVD